MSTENLILLVILAVAAAVFAVIGCIWVFIAMRLIRLAESYFNRIDAANPIAPYPPAQSASWPEFAGQSAEMRESLKSNRTEKIPDEKMRCYACASTSLAGPVETRIGEGGAVLVFRCDNCHEEVYAALD